MGIYVVFGNYEIVIMILITMMIIVIIAITITVYALTWILSAMVDKYRVDSLKPRDPKPRRDRMPVDPSKQASLGWEQYTTPEERALESIL